MIRRQGPQQGHSGRLIQALPRGPSFFKRSNHENTLTRSAVRGLVNQSPSPGGRYQTFSVCGDNVDTGTLPTIQGC